MLPLKLGHIHLPPGGLLRHCPLKPLTKHLWAFPLISPNTHTATRPHTHTVLVAPCLFVYHLPACPSSAPSVICFLLASVSLSAHEHILSAAPRSPVCLPKILCFSLPHCLSFCLGSDYSTSLFHCYHGLCNRIFPVLVDD